MEKKYRGPERRKYPRKNVNLEVDFCILTDDKSFKCALDKVNTRNIGAGGLCLFMKEPLAKGIKASVMIELPDYPDIIVAIAKVIWSKRLKESERYNIGLQYIFIKETDREKINEYVKSYKGKVYGL